MSRNIKKVTIIGHFAFGQNLLNGQTVKTKIIANELEKQLGEEQVLKIDSCGGKKVLLKMFFKAICALKNSKNVIILPAHNGLRFFAPILTFFNRFYKRKLFYIVIGGWLAQFLEKRKKLEKQLKRFDGIYVETNTMKKALENKGFQNIYIMPNCKDLKILQEEELVYPTGEPYRLCTFSRVMKEKGIEDAVNAVKSINEELGRTIYTLDIYGQIDEKQTEWFNELQKSFPEYIRYGGLVAYDKSVEVLKNYFALLFPTRFYTEGIPGTIIDAYSAGVPVISAKWENYTDVCVEGKTALSYPIWANNDLKEILKNSLDRRERLLEMKKLCLQEAKKYTKERLWDILAQNL